MIPFKQPEFKGGVLIIEPLTIKILPFKNSTTSLLSLSKIQLSNSFSLAYILPMTFKILLLVFRLDNKFG